MKRLSFPILSVLAALMLWPGPPLHAQEIGAYFTLVNTYVYRDGPQKGPRLLLRPRQAFAVVDVTGDNDETPWYRIVYPGRNEHLSGVGWTPKAPHELLPNEREPVIVYSRVLDGSDRAFSTVRVPVGALELLNETQPSSTYPRIDWQKVRYELDQPYRAWARGPAGIYRPGKTAAYLSLVYGEMVTRNVPKEKQLRLLSGVVRAGDSPREVRWALGPPLRTHEETIGEAKRTTWEYPQLVVQFENAVVKQIN